MEGTSGGIDNRCGPSHHPLCHLIGDVLRTLLGKQGMLGLWYFTFVGAVGPLKAVNGLLRQMHGIFFIGSLRGSLICLDIQRADVWQKIGGGLG